MKLKSFFDFAVQKWWIIYGLSLVMVIIGVIITVFGPSIPKPADEVVFYPWIMLREKNNPPILILLTVFILGIVLFALKRKSFEPAVLLGVTTILCCVVILAMIGPALGSMSSGFEPDPTLTHVDSIRESQHIYNLAEHKAFYEAFGNAYIFYECDSLGITCHVIYRYKPKSLEDAYASVDNLPFIEVDNTNISLHIGGKVVYTLPISTDT
jgi:hypothetical protein